MFPKVFSTRPKWTFQKKPQKELIYEFPTLSGFFAFCQKLFGSVVIDAFWKSMVAFEGIFFRKITIYFCTFLQHWAQKCLLSKVSRQFAKTVFHTSQGFFSGRWYLLRTITFFLSFSKTERNSPGILFNVLGLGYQLRFSHVPRKIFRDLISFESYNCFF